MRHLDERPFVDASLLRVPPGGASLGLVSSAGLALVIAVLIVAAIAFRQFGKWSAVFSHRVTHRDPDRYLVTTSVILDRTRLRLWLRRYSALPERSIDELIRSDKARSRPSHPAKVISSPS